MNQESRIRNKKFKVGAFVLASCFVLLASAPLALAQDDAAYKEGYLIVCGQGELPDCEFKHLVQLVVKLINFLIVLSTILATAAFAFVGIKLITSGGSESAKTEAKNIFKKVVIGYLWILFAWLLVYTISTALLNEGFFFLGSPR